MRIAMIGVGKMGLQMARHLAAGGYAVVVHDNSTTAQAAAHDAGLEVASTLAAAVAGAEVVLSSLPHDQALFAVAADVVVHAGDNAIFVDTSTVSLRASAVVAQACAQRGIAHVRATVSGNNKMAEQAQLTVLCSGPRQAYDQVEPLLRLLGPSQFYLGDGEQARLMKLVINLMIASTSGMLAEALALGEKGGLDWQQMWDVICVSAVGAPIVRAKAVQLRERDYTPTFTVEQMRKDVGLILEAGAQLDVPMALTANIEQMLRAAAAQGDAGLDYAAVIRAEARSAGLKVDAA
ncbi:MAG: 3-hydroxyisobutyrate dehydrogenase-like beta-hydroxyacid dehydrogenase [Candidatus Paceibacteria bacterium]|jgi:3-hydroxyisobutyrate dehydrogenase-like beta-hydroxyacid dehydrogenase